MELFELPSRDFVEISLPRALLLLKVLPCIAACDYTVNCRIEVCNVVSNLLQNHVFVRFFTCAGMFAVDFESLLYQMRREMLLSDVFVARCLI